MEFKSLQCPNCMGQMEISGKKVICPYCDTVMLIEGEIDEYIEEAEQNAILQMYVDESELLKDAKVWNTLCEALESGYSFEDYLQLFDKIASEHTAFGTPTKNEKAFARGLARVGQYIDNDDSLLAFCDNSFFSNAKIGFALTKKNVIFVNKDKIEKLAINDVESITRVLLNTGWFFNGKPELLLQAVGIFAKRLGIVLAYIISTARKNNGEEYTVAVYSEKLSD